MSGAIAADTVVLIHGAWQGAWAWDAFIPYLRRAGLAIEAVDLPGNGSDATPPEAVSLPLYVAHVAERIGRLGGRVKIVAHSGGGIVASQVAEELPDRISGVCYVAGMMLPDGMAFSELVVEMMPAYPDVAGVGPHLEWSDDRLTSRVPCEAALAHFFQDCPRSAGEAAAARLTPQGERGRAIRSRLSAERFGRVPRFYVEATNDRSVLPVMQRRMREMVPGAVLASLASGHVPQLAMPDILADTILPFLRS